jgi:hypothetical protein
MTTNGSDGERSERDAPVIPLAAVTREATLRRLSELRQVTDRVPDRVRSDAAVAFAWRSVDDELAALVYDSDHDPEVLENVRGEPAAARNLTFRAPGLVLEVEVSRDRQREIVCQVVPPQPARLSVRHLRSEVADQLDDEGTFCVGGLPPGPVSLRCEPLAEGASSVATSWVRI